MAIVKGARSITSIDELLTFAVGQVAAAGEECTFERLVYECFSLFPEQFAMQRYAEWPDSVRVEKTWRRCRTDRGWITGSVQEGFRLTERGKQIEARVARALGKGGSALPKAGDTAKARERHEAMLKYVRRQPSFEKYRESPEGFILSGPDDLRVLLNGTLETPRRVLRQNLRAYQNAAELYGDAEVGAFLKECDGMLHEDSFVKV